MVHFLTIYWEFINRLNSLLEYPIHLNILHLIQQLSDTDVCLQKLGSASQQGVQPLRRFTSMCTLQQNKTVLICIRNKNTELHNGAVIQPSVICSTVQKVLNSFFGKQATINSVSLSMPDHSCKFQGCRPLLLYKTKVHLDDCSDPDQKRRIQ